MYSPRVVQRRDIEGLRGVAVALVLFNHLVAVPAGGFVGVDLFFVISGFVITTTLWKETSAGSFSLRSFFIRRARRLLPSAIVTLAVVNIVVGFIFLGPRIAETHQDSLWALVFLANVHLADAGANYFAHTAPPSVLQHYWSLAVEEQFYILWPMLVLGLAWLGKRRHLERCVLPLVGALTAASFAYAVHEVAAHPERAYFSTAARAWELGVGAVLALVVMWGLTPPSWLQRLFSWGGLLLLVVATVLIDPTQPFPGVAALVPVGAGALLLLAGGGARPSAITQILSMGLPRYVGQISYPLYLWHWPVIVIGEAVWGRSALLYVIAPVLSVGLAIITHHLVEDPLRGRVPVRQAYRELKPALRGDGPVGYTPVMNAAIASVAFVLVLTTIVTVQDPASSSHPRLVTTTSSLAASQLPSSATEPPAQRALSAEIQSSLGVKRWSSLEPALDQLKASGAPEWIESGCLTVSPDNEKGCVFGSGNATRHAVIMGDSMAVSYVPGLRAFLPSQGWDIRILTQALCNNAVSVMLDGKPYDSCDAHRAWAIQRIQQLQPDLVILSNLTNIDAIVPSKLAGTRLETWQLGLTKTLHSIRNSAKKVVVVSPPPGSGNLQTCVTRFSTPDDCAAEVSSAWDRMRIAEQDASMLEGAAYINTANWYCAFGACPAVVGHTPVFVDGIHSTAVYSRHLAPVMEEQFRPFLAS